MRAQVSGQPPALTLAAETFEELFARERGPMVRVAYLITGSRAVAEEVTHDAFVRVYQRWGRIERPGAYLRRCVVNGALGTRSRREHGERLTRSLGPWGGAETADHDHTLDAVLRLPPRPRALVVLRFYEQLSVDEIAEVLQIPAGTVKSGLHRALAQLREVLA
jgi:RNA polymerase sigma-70 factor (sigma-E family)